MPFVSTNNNHANQQTNWLLSLRSRVPCFFKICTLPYSKNIAVVQTLRNRFRPSTRIFYAIKRAKFSHPDSLKVTLIICDYKFDKSIIWFISLSYASLRNGHELLQSSSSTPSPKVLIKLPGRQSCFTRPNQGLFQPTLTQNLISESRRLMFILAS